MLYNYAFNNQIGIVLLPLLTKCLTFASSIDEKQSNVGLSYLLRLKRKRYEED